MRTLRRIFGLFRRRRQTNKEPERNIFRYHNGHDWVFGDPLEIQRRLTLHPVYRADVHPLLAENGDYEALAIVDQAICDAFEVPPIDPQTGLGLTLEQRLQLLIMFGQYMELQKKSISHLPIPRQPLDSTSTPSGRPTTNASSDSGPTSTGPKSARPTEPAKPSGSPLVNISAESRQPNGTSKPTMTPNTGST